MATPCWALAKTLTQNDLCLAIRSCALALRLTQATTVGGSSVKEQKAVAVRPVLPPGLPTEMIVTAPA
jgi:hypothetical protein